MQDVIKIALGDQALHYGISLTPWERMLSQIITDDHFGADRIDYLLRDSTFTGVGFGRLDYHQLIDSLRIIPEEGRLSLGLAQSGLQAVESLLMARYLMFARVYHHPKSRLYTLHMQRAICSYFDRKGFPKSLPGYLEENDFTVLTGLTDLAHEGNYDAKAILKQGPAFEEVDLSDEKRAELISNREKYRAFKDDILVDVLTHKPGGDDFLLTDGHGNYKPARTESLFLQMLSGRKASAHLWVRPSRLKEISSYL